MYYEWYIDLFFLENVIMDGILLILVGIAMNLRHSALRLLLAAAEGGAGACILALLPVENGAAALLLQGGLAALMVKTGFPVLNGKRLIGGIAWLYGLAFFLGGILEAVRVRVELPVTVSGLIAAILSSLLIRKRKETKVQRDNLFRVTLSFHGINKSPPGISGHRKPAAGSLFRASGCRGGEKSHRGIPGTKGENTVDPLSLHRP